MRVASYLVLSSLVVIIGYLVFRVKVRRDYETGNRLSAFSTLLECLVFGLHANLIYTFLPTRWPTLPPLPENAFHRSIGLSVLVFGIAVTLWAMVSLGVRKALGQEADRLCRSGFYQYSRNPQIVVYSLVILGCVLLWPSIYGLGWILLYGAIAHMMVRTEEEYLRRIFRLEYEKYCEEVPRYLP